MRDLGELIDYENENTALDFKSNQYKKEVYENLLKDIMSLANANTIEEKFIIVGVKHYPNGSRDLLGIEENFIDEATYLQLIDSNIEPQIDFKYFPFNYKQKIFGIFQIFNSDNPPYMMKKQYGTLKVGDSYIRKGSFQTRLTRKDIDLQKILQKTEDISENIFISFAENEVIKKIKYDKKLIALPSKVTEAKIKNIILERENKSLFNSMAKFRYVTQSPFSFTKYEDRDLETLKNNLEKINEDYKEEDNYYLFEKNAHKLNFYIHNNSQKFLEDASVEIIIEDSASYVIREGIYRKPEYYNPIININPRVTTWEELNYPNVEFREGKYRIYNEVGNIKHRLPTKSFKVDLRVIITDYTVENIIQISTKIFAKNIKEPLSEKLSITI